MDCALTEDAGVLKQITQEGDGTMPSAGQIVEVHYRGTLEDGTEFDSSYSRGKPLDFELGAGAVIRGWDIGVATMKVGEKAVLTCKPEYAYGERAMGKIPANATLRFEVELMGYRDKERDKSEMEYEERMTKAKELKELGNSKVKEGNFHAAKYEFYLEALSFIEDDPVDEDEIDESTKELKAMKVMVYSNLALCEVKLGELGEAIQSCNKALELDTNNLKVLYRRATARVNFGLFTEAEADIRRGLEIEPASKEFKALHVQLQNKVKKQHAEEKKRFQGMFNKISIYDEKKGPTVKHQIPAEPNPNNPRVFLDIAVGDAEPQRVTMELFANVTPKTAENFRCLCTGEKGDGVHGKLTFEGSIFHRVIKGFMMQGGDITQHNGMGGESIYGPNFDDENFQVDHTQGGLLSMANAGPNTQSSQFFITFGATPHLNGKHVVFGRVIDGMDVVTAVENVETGENDKPKADVRVVACGQL